MNYYSPELVGYIQETDRGRRAHPEGRHLRPRPHLRRAPHRRPARLRRGQVSVRRGRRPRRRALRLPPTTLPTSLVELTDRMLLTDPTARPTIAETHTTLMWDPTLTTTTAVLTAPSPTRAPTIASRLKGRGLYCDSADAILRGRAQTRPAAHGQAPGTLRNGPGTP